MGVTLAVLFLGEGTAIAFEEGQENTDSSSSKSANAIIGVKNTNSGIGATLLGYNNQNSGNTTTAIGRGNVVTEGKGNAIGQENKVYGQASTAVGYGNIASGLESFVAGYNSTAKQQSDIAIGNGASANGDSPTYHGTEHYYLGNAIAVGTSSKATGARSVSVGYNTESSGISAVAIGTAAKATGIGSVAIGGTRYNISNEVTNVGSKEGSWAEGDASVAIGYGNHASGAYSTALGMRTTASGENSTSMGAGSTASGTYSFAIGLGDTLPNENRTTIASGNKSLAIGSGARASANNSVAIGYNVNATETFATALGERNTASGYASATLGSYNEASGSEALATGFKTKASGSFSFTTGSYTTASAFNSVAMGYLSSASGKYSFAQGNSASAVGENSAVLAGGKTSGNAKNSVALGSGATVSLADTVALGSNSVANRASGEEGYNSMTGTNSTDTSSTWKATENAIAVGADAATDAEGNVTAAVTRQIIGVAAGSKDTDAVNVAQLKAAQIHDYSVNVVDSNSDGNYTDDDTNYNNSGATGKNALAAGVSASAAGDGAVAVGVNSSASEGRAVALGDSAKANYDDTMVGYGANSNGGRYNTIVGSETSNNTKGYENTLIGFEAKTTGDTVSYNEKSRANVNDVSGATALGAHATVSVRGGIAIGHGSISDRAGGKAGYDPTTGANFTGESTTWKSTAGAFSVGGTEEISGESVTTTRQITNVAAGSADTDAVNVAQLKKVAELVSSNSGNGKPIKVTVNGSENSSDGNLKITKTTTAGQITYDLSLSDNMTVGQKGADGRDGIDGKIGVNGTNGKNGVGIDGNDGISVKGQDGKDGVTIKAENGTDGAEGHIGLIGPKGADGKNTSADISVKEGKPGVNGTDGITRIVYKDEDNKEHQTATLDDGMKYAGDSGSAAVKLNNTVTVKGGADVNNLSDNNIGVVVSQNGDNAALEVKLNRDLTGLSSVKATTINGDTINGGTVNATTVNTTTIKNGNTTIALGDTNNEVNVGGAKITNVTNGTNPGDAVNKGQLDAALMQNQNAINHLSYDINKLDTRIDRVGAGAAALAALHPQDFDPNDKWDFAAGYGHYRSANAMAIGAFYRPDARTMLSIGGSVGGGENLVNAGVTFKLGKSSPYAGYSKAALTTVIADQKTTIHKLENQVATQQK